MTIGGSDSSSTEATDRSSTQHHAPVRRMGMAPVHDAGALTSLKHPGGCRVVAPEVLDQLAPASLRAVSELHDQQLFGATTRVPPRWLLASKRACAADTGGFVSVVDVTLDHRCEAAQLAATVHAA